MCGTCMVMLWHNLAVLYCAELRGTHGQKFLHTFQLCPGWLEAMDAVATNNLLPVVSLEGKIIQQIFQLLLLNEVFRLNCVSL